MVAAAVRHDSHALHSGLKALPSDALRRRVTRLAKEETARREMNPGATAEAAPTTGDDPVRAAWKAAAEGDERPLRSLLEPGVRGTNRRHALRLRLLTAPETASHSRLAREVIDSDPIRANRAELLAARALARLPRR